MKSGIGLAATGSLLARAASAAAAVPATGAQAQALSYALQTERLSVIVYRQVLATSVVSQGIVPQLRMMLSQDLQHAAKLEQVLTEMGADLPQGPTGVPAAQAMLLQHGIHRSLTALHTQRDCLRVLVDAESLTEGAYFKAIPELQEPALVRLSTEILGSDAQHWAVLSGIQHPDDLTVSVPYPFVQGSP